MGNFEIKIRTNDEYTTIMETDNVEVASNIYKTLAELQMNGLLKANQVLLHDSREEVLKEQYIKVIKFVDECGEDRNVLYKLELDDGDSLVITPCEIAGLQKILKELEVEF